MIPGGKRFVRHTGGVCDVRPEFHDPRPRRQGGEGVAPGFLHLQQNNRMGKHRRRRKCGVTKNLLLGKGENRVKTLDKNSFGVGKNQI